jgi:hypothetical protein
MLVVVVAVLMMVKLLEQVEMAVVELVLHLE